MRSLIYANYHSRKPADSLTGSGMTFPKLIAGQKWTISLRFSNRVEGAQEEIFPLVKSLTARVGHVDARPTSGTVKWQVGVGVSTAANTTPAFDWNKPGHEIEALLNALSGFPDAAFTVTEDSGSYFVSRADGTEVKITLRANRLTPLCHIPDHVYQVDGETITEVRYTQLPALFTDTSAQVLPKAPYIKTVVDGRTSDDGTFKQDEVQNLIIPPEFRGQFFLQREYDKTELFSIDDGAEQIQDAYNALLSLEGGSVTVTNPAAGIARMVYGGDLSGINVSEPLVVVPVEGTPPGDWTFTLDATRPEVWSALRGKKEVTLPFEVTIEIPKDENEPDGERETKILWQESLIIAAPVGHENLATEQNIDWLRPASPRNYKRFSPDTVLVGQQHYLRVFGDGEETEPVFDHNLGTANFSGLEVIDNDTGRFLLRGEEYQVSASTENTLTLTFAEAPTEDSLFVVITTAGPTSAFVEGLTVEIDQVNGLGAILDNFGARITNLETYLPSTGPGATQSSTTGMVTILPLLAEVLLLAPEDISEDLFNERGRLEVKNLPESAPYMLPALHDAATETLPTPLPKPSLNAGKVFKNESGAARLIYGGGGIPSIFVPNNGYVACDGRSLIVAERDGATNSYYPTAFEKTLFTLAVNDKQLALGRTLHGEWSLLLQLVKALRQTSLFCQAQWVFRLELGTAPQDADPDPVGLNLQNIVWSDSAIYEQRIVLDTLFQAHAFGIRIHRSASGISLDQQLYGIWGGNNGAAPASANFVLRGRMTKFDTENNQPRARGFVYLGLSAGMDQNGELKDESAKFVIS